MTDITKCTGEKDGKVCFWTNDSDEYADGDWDTSCDNRFVLNEGTPHENKMRFCCYCGKSLRRGYA